MITKNDSRGVILKISLVMAAISLILVFFIGSFSGLVFNNQFYVSLFEKSGTYERADKIIADEKVGEVLLFFKEKGELDKDFFTLDEISHMEDVRKLIKKVFFAYYAGLILLLLIAILVFLGYKADFSIFLQKLLFYSGASTLLISILIISISFTNLFEAFHRLFFVSNYTFPSSSGLIMLFNNDFFYMFAKRIFLISSFKGAIAGFIGGFFLYRKT